MAKAIETVYKGYRFRSRLEARWAVFFDTLEIEYRYELEGFQLKDNLKYLPDFYLPKLKTWVEIKPFMPTDEEQYKCSLLADATKERVWIAFGDIPYPHPGYNSYPYGSGGSGIMIAPDFWDMPYWFCICHDCGDVGIEFDGRGARINCGCSHAGHGNGDKCYNADDQRLVDAYAAARQARFEFGENGGLDE